MTKVLLSLGANLGDRSSTLEDAVDQIARRQLLHHITRSELYETEPVGYVEQPAFLNCCISGTCLLSAHELKIELGDIENDGGRIHRPQWHEREIDIDVILFGNSVVHDRYLHIPHPRMHERRFVLAPASQVAASMTHPILLKTIWELLDECADSSALRLFESEMVFVDSSVRSVNQ